MLVFEVHSDLFLSFHNTVIVVISIFPGFKNSLLLFNLLDHFGNLYLEPFKVSFPLFHYLILVVVVSESCDLTAPLLVVLSDV